GVAVGLVTQCLRGPQVCRGAFGERDGVADGSPYEGVGELGPWSVHADEAGLLGRCQRVGVEFGYPPSKNPEVDNLCCSQHSRCSLTGMTTRREHLLDAAIRVLGENGVRAVT